MAVLRNNQWSFARRAEWPVEPNVLLRHGVLDRLEVRQHRYIAEFVDDRVLDFFEQIVANLDRPRSRHQQVEGHKSAWAGLAGTHRVPLDASIAEAFEHSFNRRSFGSWNGRVEQSARRASAPTMSNLGWINAATTTAQ